MKAIKYLVAGALMLSISAPSMAQDVKSQIDAITKVVVDAKGDVVATKAPVKEFMKANKKNAEAIAGLGRAFLAAKNFEQAKIYADQAMKVGKAVAAGYILRGDIASAEDDGGMAASYYEMATQQAPQEPTAYVKYARVYQKVDFARGLHPLRLCFYSIRSRAVRQGSYPLADRYTEVSSVWFVQPYRSLQL